MAEFDMNVMRQVLYGDGVEKLFAFGYCGFYVFDPLTPGSGTWTKLVENFEIAAAVPADASEGYFMMDMAFSVSNPGHAWGVCRTQAYAGLNWGYRLIVCHTHDGWESLQWANSVYYNNNWHPRMRRAQIAIANDGTDEVLYLAWQSAHQTGGNWGVKKSIDGGFSWNDSYLDTVPGYNVSTPSLYCPYSNPKVIYATIGEGIKEFIYSTDAGENWSSPYSLPYSYPIWLSGPPTDASIVSLLDQKRGMYEWDGAAFNEWGEYWDWWGAGKPDAEGGWAQNLRVLERDGNGGLVKAIMGGYDRADKGKILLMEAAGRTVITENWNVVADDHYPMCICLPAMIRELT